MKSRKLSSYRLGCVVKGIESDSLSAIYTIYILNTVNAMVNASSFLSFLKPYLLYMEQPSWRIGELQLNNPFQYYIR